MKDYKFWKESEQNRSAKTSRFERPVLSESELSRDSYKELVDRYRENMKNWRHFCFWCI